MIAAIGQTEVGNVDCGKILREKHTLGAVKFYERRILWKTENIKWLKESMYIAAFMGSYGWGQDLSLKYRIMEEQRNPGMFCSLLSF